MFNVHFHKILPILICTSRIFVIKIVSSLWFGQVTKRGFINAVIFSVNIPGDWLY